MRFDRAANVVLFLAAALALGGCASNDGYGRGETRGPGNSKSASPGLAKPKNAAESRAEAAKINVSLGQSYLEQGKLEIAKQKLDKALALDPKSPDAHTVIAVLYERIKDDKSARVHYKRATELAPKNGAVFNNYGQFLCRRGEYAEADRLFLKALADPFYATPAVAHSNRGTCALSAGNAQLAEDSFRTAIQIDPNQADSLFRLAEILHAKKDFFRARAFVQRHEGVAGASPGSLALAMRIEQGLGDVKAASAYKQRLFAEFPESEQAQQLKNQDATQ